MAATRYWVSPDISFAATEDQTTFRLIFKVFFFGDQVPGNLKKLEDISTDVAIADTPAMIEQHVIDVVVRAAEVFLPPSANPVTRSAGLVPVFKRGS